MANDYDDYKIPPPLLRPEVPAGLKPKTEGPTLVDLRSVRASFDEPPPEPNGSSLPEPVYRLVSIADALAEPHEPDQFVLDGVLVSGTCSMLVAKPKVGKGTLARNLALCVSRGEPFLGRTTLQGPVIYFALEERLKDVTSDFRAMGATEADRNLHIFADRPPESAVWELIELIREKTPRLAIVDPVIRLIQIRDANSYAEMYAALGPLIDISRETGTHLMLLHHAGKAERADLVDIANGSIASSAGVASILALKRREQYRTFSTVQRIGEDFPESVLNFDPDTKILTLGGTKQEADQTEAERRVLAFLESTDEATEKDIREKVEGRTMTKWAALSRLRETGLVEQLGIGRRGDPYRYRKISCSLVPNICREQGNKKLKTP